MGTTTRFRTQGTQRMMPAPEPFLLRTSYLCLFLLLMLYGAIFTALFSGLPFPLNGLVSLLAIYSAYHTFQKQVHIQKRRHIWSITPQNDQWILGIGNHLETDFRLAPDSIITSFVLVLRFKRKRHRTQRRTVLLFPDSFENVEAYRDCVRYCRLLQAHQKN